jgi:hypothetical protein
MLAVVVEHTTKTAVGTSCKAVQTQISPIFVCVRFAMKATVICVKYGGEVRSFGLCDNMAVAELVSMLSNVFDLETGIVGLVMPVSLTCAGEICWMFNAVIGSWLSPDRLDALLPCRQSREIRR